MTTKNAPIQISQIVAQVIATMVMLPKGRFVGIREYTNNSNELANHVVQANFNYGKAKKDDYEVKLANISDLQIANVIAKVNTLPDFQSNPTTAEEVKTTVESLLFTYHNPKEKTEKQENTYTQIDGTTLKVENATGLVHFYSLAVQKTVLSAGEYKPRKSYRKTVIQDTIKRELNFTLLKFRQFVCSADKLTAIKMQGEQFELV